MEKAYEFVEQAGEAFEIEEFDSKVIAGTPEYVKGILNQLQKAYRVDEFILHTPIEKDAERIQSFQLLSPLNIGEEGIKATESEAYVVK